MKIRKVNSSVLLIALLSVSIFLIQSCDLTSQEESFENPYTQKTEQTFNKISEAVFGNVAQNLENKAYGTVSENDIMRYANEGYRQWAQNNGAELNAFNAGVKASRRMQRLQLQSGKSGSKTENFNLDSLLTELELNKKQRKFILEIPKIVGKSGNIAKLERKLNKFDEKVFKQLGEEDSKPVLQLSALMQASMEFITTDARMLATLAELIDENNKQQSHFYRPSLINKDEGAFHLTQTLDGQTDPPDWGDYYNSQHAAYAMIGGAMLGTYVGTKWGAGAGLLGGPWGSAIGGAIGSVLGFGLGAGGGYNTYKLNKSIEYTEDLESWCKDKSNQGHSDYEDYCSIFDKE